MTERNENTSNLTTTGVDRTDYQPDNRRGDENNENHRIEEEDDDKYDYETTLLMMWLTQKDWIQSIHMIKEIKSTTGSLHGTAALNIDMEVTSRRFHHMIQLLHQYPNTFLHYMEQSNDKNQNWDAIILLIQQLSDPDNFHTDTDIGRKDHESLSTFLSTTILIPKRGWTLLHWLCSHGGTPIQVIETLVQHFATTGEITKMILQPDTYIDDTCLHLLCRNACQFSATKLQILLSSLSDQDEQNGLLLRNRLGGTILHAATIGAAVFDVIHTIVSIQPRVVSISSKDGVYPVTALYYSYSDTIPGYMSICQVLNDPDHDYDYYARPSLHEMLIHDNHLGGATSSDKKPNSTFQRFWEKVEYIAVHRFLLSDQCPTELLKCHKKGESDDNIIERRKYILHGLLQCNVPIKMIKLCLRLHPISATAVDRQGNTPLHVLLQNRPYHHGMFQNQEYESIQYCIRTYPLAAGMVNHSQPFVPLQLAILNKIPVSSGIYDLLLHAAPNTIHYRCTAPYTTPTRTTVANDENDNDKKDFDGAGFYPFQLAAIQNNTSLQSINTIYYLLLKQPSLLCARNG